MNFIKHKYWIFFVLILSACGDVVVNNKLAFTDDKSMQCIYHPESSFSQNCAPLLLRNFNNDIGISIDVSVRSDVTVQVIPIETYSGNSLYLGQSISNQYSGPVYSEIYKDMNPGRYSFTIELDDIPVDGYYRIYLKNQAHVGRIDFMVVKNFCAIPLQMQDLRKKVDDRYRKCK